MVTMTASCLVPGAVGAPLRRRHRRRCSLMKSWLLINQHATSPSSRRLSSVRVTASAEDEESSVDDPLAAQFKKMYPGGSGQRIKWGVFKEEVSATQLLDASDSKALRDAASENLTNIDDDERGRRYKAGAGAAVFSVALATFQIFTGAPPSQRAIMALPLFFAIGFVGSGASGL